MNTMIKCFLVIAVLLSACMLPATAGDQNWAVDSFFDIFYEVQGTTGVHVGINAAGTAVTRQIAPDPTGTFDTEMLPLNLTGVSPFGHVQIRESPTKASQGRLLSIGDPDFDLLRVNSFFDVFMEISIDGGQTWAHNDEAAHYSGGDPDFDFYDITYLLDNDVQFFGNGHVTVLKAGSTLDMTAVPEPGTILAALSILGPATMIFRRRKMN